MKIHILTIFPDSFNSYINSSILKIAQEKSFFEPIFYNICDFSKKNTRRVDDRPYSGWAGTLISVEPLFDAINFIEKKEWKELKKIFLSPDWEKLSQKLSQKFADENLDLLIICWHYEWVDARIFELFDIQKISIGDYVLTSWELAAMVFIDSIVRLIPWVLSSESLEEESFSQKLEWKKEYPQYTRPEEFMWLRVPEELLSGNPKIIEKWKRENLK